MTAAPSRLRRLALTLSFAVLCALVPCGPATAETVETEPLVPQDYEPAPAIWRLSDADTTIYLFGTIHLLPEGFRWRSAQFDTIVAEVDTLVLESSDADAEASLAQYAGKLENAVETLVPTSLRLSPQAATAWQLMIEGSGQPFETIDTMPLALAILGFGGDPSLSGLSSYEYGVETVLEAEFAASGRPVESIENHAGVMLALLQIDDAPMLAELESGLTQYARGNAPLMGSGRPAPAPFSMEHAWAQGQIAEDFDLGLGEGKIGAAFQRVLLQQRNEAWSHWLAARLEQPGSVLVAVGAGHFEGEGSLLDFLVARGLQAERID